jgi:hypothetical protein
MIRILVNNVNLHKNLCKLIQIKVYPIQNTDLKPSVFHLKNNIKQFYLKSFKIGKNAFNKICKMIPMKEGAKEQYLTIKYKIKQMINFLKKEFMVILCLSKL